MCAAHDVDTRRAERRELHFDRVGELPVDIDGFGGCPEVSGNWSAPQIVDHVASLIDASLDGFESRAPWFLRMAGPLMKKRVLRKGMSPGLKIPAGFRQLTPESDATWDEAVAALHASVKRFQDQGRVEPSPIFGNMSHNEWEQLHCRHAELHFAFLKEGT